MASATSLPSRFVDKSSGEGLNRVLLVHALVRVEDDGIAEAEFADERFYFAGLFVGDRQDDQSQVGHFTAARRTPGGPEVHKHDLAAQILQHSGVPMQVGELEIGLLVADLEQYEHSHDWLCHQSRPLRTWGDVIARGFQSLQI